jgi:phenylalanyl-tRNA synthetase beta chain
MRVPLGWLREYVDLPPDAGAIAQRLAMLGFPVDAIETRPAISGVVVAKIVSLEKHPNADRLQVAKLDAGGSQALTVATAATNVAAGQTIALATIGARLPEMTIAPRTMRGIASEGMMISAGELALPPDWFEDGILQLEPERVPGTDVAELYGLNDAVLDVEITANRADAMSIAGIARELAASYGVPLRLPESNPVAPYGTQTAPDVELKSPDCTRFVVQRFDGVPEGLAPAWMRVRLALAGQRPIDAVVDVTNYVMFEIGQPLHAYDAGRIAGRIVVRDARDGERLTTLDGVERSLTSGTLVIADDEKALGLAGLMGGAESEVRSGSRAIVLESAIFNGTRVRRAGKALGLRSEAASRHERSMPPAAADGGAARAARLLQTMGAAASPPRTFGPPAPEPAPIQLPPSEVHRLLGIALPADRIAAHLTALGCTVTANETDLLVTPPPWRRDLTIAADLVEEVARLEGYDRIEPVLPSIAPHAISSADFERERSIAGALARLGYRETITRTLHGAAPLEKAARSGVPLNGAAAEVLNPLSEDQRYLRASLFDGLLGYFAGGARPIRLFEIGSIFERRDGEVRERQSLLFGFSTEPLGEPAWHDSALLRLKGDALALLREIAGRNAETTPSHVPGLHPGKSASLTIDAAAVATFGRVDPRLAKAYDIRLPAYLCEIELAALPERRPPHYRPPSKFPGTARDVALIVDIAVAAADVERALASAIGELCTSVAAFDEYRGPQVPSGRKSIAVRMELRRSDATITDREADDAVARALPLLQAELGATVRQ